MDNTENLIQTDPLPDHMNSDMQSVYDYWKEKALKAAPLSLPKLSDLELIDLYKVSANLLIGDVHQIRDQATQYVWRYWGGNLATFFDVEMTGKNIAETYTKEASRQISKCYDWVVLHKKPHYWSRWGGLASDDQEYLAYERLICPVLGESGEVEHLFGIITFENNPSEIFTFNESERTSSSNQ